MPKNPTDEAAAVVTEGLLTPDEFRLLMLYEVARVPFWAAALQSFLPGPLAEWFHERATRRSFLRAARFARERARLEASVARLILAAS